MTDSTDAVRGAEALATLARQLREGPIQELTELHRRTTLLSETAATSRQEQVQQLTELALVSLEAMAHFHAFTRELGARIAEITAAAPRDLH